MQKLRKNLKQCQNIDNQKSQTMERYFFTCFCGKNYETYPSLYLHSKKIHDKWINKNQLKITSFRWSGSIKNKYYELQEERNKQESKQAPAGKLCQPIVYKTTQIKSNMVKRVHTLTKGKTNRDKFDKVKHKIEKVFSQYFLQSVKTNLGQIGAQYLKYLLQSFDEPGREKICAQFEGQGYLQMIPILMNDYILRLGMESGDKSYGQVTSQLERISKWMYQKGHCKYLAVLERNYNLELKKQNEQKNQD